MCEWCNDNLSGYEMDVIKWLSAYENEDFLLSDLTEMEIRGLDDSFDDGRIWVLIDAYLTLRDAYIDREMNE